ncbi:A/G-specific adenine glycosylase [Camelimonas fluminis]|nr:A/G-specific adenine glycosylase [Camelimonas fluminis]
MFVTRTPRLPSPGRGQNGARAFAARRRGAAKPAPVDAAAAPAPPDQESLLHMAAGQTSQEPDRGAAVPEAGPDPAALLGWYDAHRRTLPWRAPPGAPADPYRVWLSEIMLQQTTVTAVQPFYARFLARFPDVNSLASAPAEAVMQAWAGLGYYSRARNLHACARTVVAEHGGAFPASLDGLLALPGVGPYTAAAVGAIAFDLPAAAVDGNVERVISRIYRVEEPLPGAKPRIRALTQALVPALRPGDFAQAMMDLGAMICTPRRPACGVCPWMGSCAARAAGDAETFPRKAPKKAVPSRFGAAFVGVRADGAVLLRTRPPEGLLGGMDEPPGGAWREGDAMPALADLLQEAPFAAPWRPAPGGVRHVFTHFRLELVVFVAIVATDYAAPAGMRWVRRADLARSALPNVMRKVVAHGLEFAGRARSGVE